MGIYMFEKELFISLLNDYFSEEYPLLTPEEQYKYSVDYYYTVKNKAVDYVLAYDTRGKIIGFAVLLPREDVTASSVELSNLYIKKGFRGFGYGRELLNAIIEKAEESSADYLFVEPTKGKEYVFESRGFSALEDFSEYVKRVTKIS